MKKHHIWVVGFLGASHAYLDISEAEARRRYEESEFEIDESWMAVYKIDFDDEFGVYDIWGEE